MAAEQLPILRAPSPLTANRRSTRLPDIDRRRINITRKHPLRLLPNLSARLIKRLIAHKISAQPIDDIIAGEFGGEKSRVSNLISCSMKIEYSPTRFINLETDGRTDGRIPKTDSSDIEVTNLGLSKRGGTWSR